MSVPAHHARVLGTIRRVVVSLANAAVNRARKKNPKSKCNPGTGPSKAASSPPKADANASTRSLRPNSPTCWTYDTEKTRPNIAGGEFAALEQFAMGVRFKEASGHLGICVTTVRTHLEHIYAKLHAANVHASTLAEFVAMYSRERAVGRGGEKAGR